MADEEKKYLITADAEISAAMTKLGELQAAIDKLGTSGSGNGAPVVNNVSTQAQTNVDAINREIAAYENLNRARRESQGGLARTSSAMTTRESLVETKAGITGYSGIEKEADEVMQRIIKTRYDKEKVALSQSVTEIQNLKAQRAQGVQFTDISRTTDAAGKVQELAVSYKDVAGKTMEFNRVLTENGAKVSQTATSYKVLDGEIRGTTKTTENFAQTAEQSANTLGHFMSRMRFMAEWFAFYAVIQLVQKGLQDWNQAQIALSDEMANFEIVTRGSNASAETYLNTVNAISKATAINPAEIGPGVVAQMRVFNAPSDLALRAAQVQRVTGVDNAQVQREIMGLRLQFPDRSTINILDAFSGALKRSSLSAEELFGLLETAGPLSQQFNTGLEQILGMMAGLSTVTSESGQAVELFMRQMDRLYSDPNTRGKVEQFTGKPVVGTDLTTGQEVRRPLYDVMADISKLDQSQVQEIANTIPNALGQKTRQLFVAMVNGWANVEDATKSAMVSQGEFLAQNETKMKSYAAAIDSVSAAWQRLLRGLGDAGGATAAMRELATFLDNIGTSLGRLGNTDVSPAQRAEASLKTSSIWGLLYSLAEDVLPSGGDWGPSPRRQRQMQAAADEDRERYPRGWNRMANDMSDPTKIGSTAWQNAVQIPTGVIPIEGITKEMTQAYLDSRAKIVDAIQTTATTSYVNPQATQTDTTQIRRGAPFTPISPQTTQIDMTRMRGDALPVSADIVARALKIYEERINKQVTDMILESPLDAPRAQEPKTRQVYRSLIEQDATANTYYDKMGDPYITLVGNAKDLAAAFAQATTEVSNFPKSAASSLLQLSPDKTAAGLWGGKALEGGMSRAPANPFAVPGFGDTNIITRALKIYEEGINKQVTDMILASSVAARVQDPAVRQTYRAKIEGEVTTNTYYDKTSGSLITLTGNAESLGVAFAQATTEVGNFYKNIQENAAASLLRLSPDKTAPGLWGGKTPEDYKVPRQRIEVPGGIDYGWIKDYAKELQDEFVFAQRGLNPALTAGKTDAQVLDLAGIKTEMVSLVDSMGVPVGQVNSAFAFLAPAINAATKALEDMAIPAQRFEVPERYMVQSKFGAGEGADKLISNELTDFARKLQGEYVASYRNLYPEQTMGKTDTQVLDLTGISSRFTTLTDNFGNALGTVDIALVFLANAANNTAAALSSLSFVSPPEGVSLGAYGSLAQSYAIKAQSTLDQYGDPNKPSPKRSQIWADDEGGIFKTTVAVSDQAAAIGLGAASKQLSIVASQGKEANALLKQISEGVRDFAEKLLTPTPVTKGDMALAKTGGYKDKWDEPVRKIQDVLDRREGDNPDLGPWKGFAEAMGIDLSSKESTMATGEQFKSDFYSGNKPAEFYDQYSKEGFLRAAKEELAAQQGKERLTNQAMGWLKEDGMDKDVAKFIGRKMTGDISPIEDMLYGGKDPKKVGKEIEDSAKPIGDGLVKGIGSAFTFDAMFAALEAGWKLKDAEAQKKIRGLGNQVGALLTSGAATSFGDQFLDAVIAAVLARLDKEYM